MPIRALATLRQWVTLRSVRAPRLRTALWCTLDTTVSRTALYFLASGLNLLPIAVAGRRTPTVVIVKCGTEAEMNDPKTKKKAGNRGKRDSQLVLMNFFSHVTYNDRMTPLDFDLFRKVQVLMGVTPDFFEVTLMVSRPFNSTARYQPSLTRLMPTHVWASLRSRSS